MYRESERGGAGGRATEREWDAHSLFPLPLAVPPRLSRAVAVLHPLRTLSTACDVELLLLLLLAPRRLTLWDGFLCTTSRPVALVPAVLFLC